MIVSLLFAVEGADFLYLQHETNMNKGTLSSHISRLEEVGYVEVEKTYRGKVPQTLLTLTKAGRKSLRAVSAKAKRSAVDACSRQCSPDGHGPIYKVGRAGHRDFLISA